MSITTNQHGSISVTGRDDIELYALLCGVQAMKMHVQSGGKMRLTRVATPANIAARFALVDPKTKRAPKTAKACLRLLEAKLAQEQKVRGTDEKGMMRRVTENDPPVGPAQLN